LYFEEELTVLGRNIGTVISTALDHFIPKSETELRRRLSKVKQDAGFKPPEFMNDAWQAASEALMEHATPSKGQWAAELARYWTTKEATVDTTNDPYILSDDANTSGTSRLGTLAVSPAAFLRTFGPANAEGDDYKVDREWVFKALGGEVITVYAYKATNLYDPVDGDPTPDEFWAGEESYDLSVGGNDQKAVNGFIAFAKARMGVA
jgi:hypothetical protein